MSAQSATVTFTRTITVAAGVFAPGHLGELTQFAPFELVDDILERTRAVQRRLRDLPSRVGVYFLLALGLFPGLGYRQVWAKLTAGLKDLAGLQVAAQPPSAPGSSRRPPPIGTGDDTRPHNRPPGGASAARACAASAPPPTSLSAPDQGAGRGGGGHGVSSPRVIRRGAS